MKKPFAILLLLFSYSSLYSQSWWDKAWWGGGGMGYGKNGASFQATGVSGSSVFHIAGNIFNGRSEEDTFQFSPNLFDDKDKGKLREAVWMGIGYYKKVGNTAFSIAGGISSREEYFIKEDATEILSDEGIYYVKDDESSSFMPTVILSSYTNIGKTEYDKKVLGITLNFVPIDLSLVLLFP